MIVAGMIWTYVIAVVSDIIQDVYKAGSYFDD